MKLRLPVPAPPSVRVRSPLSLWLWIACIFLTEPGLRIAYVAGAFPQTVGPPPSGATLLLAALLHYVALAWVFLLVPLGLVLALVPARLRVTSAGLEWRWMLFTRAWSGHSIDVVFGHVDRIGLVSVSRARMTWRRSLVERRDLTTIGEHLRALVATSGPPGSPYRGIQPR